MRHNFIKLCEWLDGQAEMFTVTELHEMMVKLSDGSNVYSVKRLKQKLEEHYKDDSFFTDEPGRSNVVCFRNTASSIITEAWYKNKKDDINEKTKSVIVIVAQIIRNEARSLKYSTEIYRCRSDINTDNDSLPPLLRYFIQILLAAKLKQQLIGQCILKALKPNSVIPPLLFGLGVEMDHMFGSKWLINELYRLGYSISCSEVTRFKQSILTNGTPTEHLQEDDRFTQWVADNVDHNTATLDGKGTFHGMGIISCSNYECDLRYQHIRQNSKIMRLMNYLKAKVLKCMVPITRRSSIEQHFAYFC